MYWSAKSINNLADFQLNKINGLVMSSINKLIDLINADNPHPALLSEKNITFSVPIVDIGETWNTAVTVSAIKGSGYVGQVVVRYNRIDLSNLGSEIGIISEEAFTADTVVSILNRTRGSFISLDDVSSIAIPVMNVGDIETIALTAKTDSLGWTGRVDISLLMGLPENTGLLHELLNIELPLTIGPMYPADLFHTLFHVKLPSSNYLM